MSKELRSFLFSSLKLCWEFCSLQYSFKVLTAFCAALFVDFEVLSPQFDSMSSFVRTSKRFHGHDWDKIVFFTRLDKNLPRFQGARPDHVRVESLSYRFPRNLVSFVPPRELDCFDQWHVTRSCPIKKAFELGGITKQFFYILRWKWYLGFPFHDHMSAQKLFFQFLP